MVKKVLKQFPVEYLQVLDENGNADKDLMPALSQEDIKIFYEHMVLVRAFDQKAFTMQRQGRIGTYIQVKGQEACQVGAALALRDDDFIFPIYRDSGMLLTRKQPMSQILQYWSGDERGLRSPDTVNNFTIAIPIATQIPHAVGAGWAAKMQGKDQIALVSFGDGATSRGDFHEGMNFAGVFKIPVIFFCQNNQYAISVPRDHQTGAETIAQKAIGYGITGIVVDGNDIFAVYTAVKEAVERARKGQGPTLIECYTYRMGDHSTSDDASRYRPKEEMEKWIGRDPIQRLEKYMRTAGILTDDYKAQVTKKAVDMVEQAVLEFEKISPPDKDDIFTFVYAQMSQRQIEQKNELNNQNL